LHWEFGVLLGLNSKVPNNTWRLLVEYEY